MARKKMHKVTLRLEAGDADIIMRFYPTLGYQTVIRKLVHQFARRLEERGSQAGLTTNLEEIDVPS